MHPTIATLTAFALFLPSAALEGGESPWVLIDQLFGSDTDTQDSFGESVAIDGDTLAVAAYRKDGETGAVYIFERSPEPPTEWVEAKKLSPQLGDTFFGLVLAISDDTLGVRSLAPDGRATYLFGRDWGGEGVWGLMGRFASESMSGLEINDNTLIVGDVFYDVEGQLDAGAAHLFERGPDGPIDWAFVTTLTASDAMAQDRFGGVQSVSRNSLLIGVPDEDDFGDDSGAAYVFERDETGQWLEVAKLLRPDPQANDDFGFEVDLDVDTALIASPGGPGREAAVLFERDNAGAWSLIKVLDPPGGTGEAFAKAVGQSGSVAAVGATGHDLPDADGAGAVYIFERDSGGIDAWGEVATLVAPDPQELDRLGDPIAIDRNTLVVGVHEDDDRGFDSGTVYLFSRTEPLLSILGSCPGELSVSVIGTTPAGRVVLVGAQSEGVTAIPSGPCAGTELGLSAPRVFFDGTATSGGDLLLRPEVGDATCGRLVQAVDLGTCMTSPVAEIR